METQKVDLLTSHHQSTAFAGSSFSFIPRQMPSGSLPSSSENIGLTAQLIIWGMVGFILIELLAIVCLLRYCCRARYITKRKFVEREIIVSDHPDTSMTKVLINRDNINNSINGLNNTHIGDLTTMSAPVLISNNTTTSSTALPILTNNINKNHNNSIVKSHPILFNQTQPDQNDTIMVDDIMSIYSQANHPSQTTQNISYSITTCNHPKKPNHYNQNNHKLQNQKNYLNKSYNNQSVDSINLICNSESNLSNKNILSEKMRKELFTEDIYTLRFATTGPTTLEPLDPSTPKEQHSYLYNGSINKPAFEIISHADIRSATPIKYEQCKELINLNKLYDNNNIHKSKSTVNKYDNNVRSNTSPIRLNFGNQMSVKQTGQPVEWQMASELRTVDWDKLKNASNNCDKNNSSYLYTSIDELNEVAKKTNNNNNSSFYLENENNNYNNIKHSTIGVKNPFNDLKLSSNNNSDTNTSKLATIAATTTVSETLNDTYDGEQKNYTCNTVLDENNLCLKNNNFNKDNNKNNSDITSNNLFEDPSGLKTSIGRDNRGGRRLSGENGDQRGSSGRFRTRRTNEEMLKSREHEIQNENEINHNTKSRILTKIIRDLETNEILSVKFIKDPNNNNNNNTNLTNNTNDDVDSSISETNNININNLIPNSNLNKSNVSIIDVTYNPNQEYKNTSEDEKNDNFNNLLPPAQFQQNNDQSRRNSSNKLTNTSNKFYDKIKRLSSSNIRDANGFEDFKSGNEINLNTDEIEIESIRNMDSKNSTKSGKIVPAPPPPPPPQLLENKYYTKQIVRKKSNDDDNQSCSENSKTINNIINYDNPAYLY